jgi:transposase-like protein
LKQRQGGRIVGVAAIIAVAAATDGRREIIGLSVGDSEAMAFWMAFLRSLVKRGLKDVKLVVSDAHEGLKAAICKTGRAHRELTLSPGRQAIPPSLELEFTPPSRGRSFHARH